MTESNNTAPPAGPKLAAGMGQADAATARSAAQAEAAQFRAGTHPQFAAFAKGDKAAAAHFENVHRAAFPDDEGAVAAPGTAARAEHDADIAALRAEIAPPLNLRDYKLTPPPGGKPIPLDVVNDLGEGLRAGGVPISTASVLWKIGTALVQSNGNQPFSPEALEAGRQVALMQLRGRHGDEEAARIVADARSVVKRIEAKSPGAVLAMMASGLGNHVQAIELLANLARAQRAASRGV